MKKANFKRIVVCLLAALMLSSTLAACTEPQTPVETTPGTPGEEITMPDATETPTEEETDPPITEPPTVSLDQLTFTPASPEGQVLTEKGHSPQIIIRNYNETATDALGRVLPTSAEAGLPKEGKYVGLFYLLWTTGFNSTTDNSKVLAVDPYDPDFGPKNGFCWWSEPETGYHRADDVWQIRRDMYYFAMAGVDFLYIDFTNGYMYEDAFRVLLDTCLQMRAEGQMTPYIVPWSVGRSDKRGEGQGADVSTVYELFMTEEKYKDLWFYWDGKPLVLLKPDANDLSNFPVLSDEYYTDKLTFRKSWITPTKYAEMYWSDNQIVNQGYGYGYVRDENNKKIVECAGLGPAGFAEFGQGRSGALSTRPYLDAFLETDTMGEGLVFQNAFDQLMTNNPECQVLLISRWNEWGAQNFTYAMTGDTGFVDQFNAEFSRDIEPMKGGYTDNYFYQMCSIIRHFKGVLPADGASGANTMTETDEDVFEKWEEICPVYTDFEGDTSHRNHSDAVGKIQYVNTTGRNDIVESRITADGGNLYVYVRTAETMTPYTESPNWMLLFLDADNDKTTGWEGYDFLVNYEVISDTVTTLCAYKNGVWQEIGTVAYATKGDRMTVTIPRSLLGLTGDNVKVNFHWMDNVTDVYNLESWFTTGDSAPERRNNYAANLAIAYTGNGETILPVRDGDTIDGMPAIVFSESQMEEMANGLRAYTYPLVENYPAQPNFTLIADLLDKNATCFVPGVTTYGLPRTNHVGVVYEGYVYADETKDYTFVLSYDDGVKLYVDGRLVVDGSYDKENPETYKTAEGKILLSAGYHCIRVEYVELNGENARLALEGDWKFCYTDMES